MLKDAAIWVGNKLAGGFIWVLKQMGIGGAVIVSELDYIFLLGAIVGVYLIMAGNKRLGTKFTSLSILSYLIARVVLDSAF